jgi:2-polyprenyl-6-methoxyphenol hydroxylase-like FAD-dependent oxidoreductase
MHAVVLGAGMAGLLTARVLSDFYDRVTIVERDRLLDNPIQQMGIPQRRRLHGFPSRGCRQLDDFFPGILGDMPFVDLHVRRRVAAIPHVNLLDHHNVWEPTVITRDRVSGVLLADRDTGKRTAMDADLVVDAMGRGARTSAFLEKLGYGRPAEHRSAANWAYSSRLLRVPDGDFIEKVMLIDPGMGLPRAGLSAHGNDTWILTVGRLAADGEPPADLADMLALVERSLPSAILAGLRTAQPLDDVAIFRDTAGVWRRYDQMQEFPAGLLVIGDALCSLDPVYGNGTTMVALEALALREYLRDESENPQRFFRAAAGYIGPAWAMSEANDAHRRRSRFRSNTVPWWRRADRPAGRRVAPEAPR